MDPADERHWHRVNNRLTARGEAHKQDEEDRFMREIAQERARRYWEDDTMLGGAMIYEIPEEP